MSNREEFSKGEYSEYEGNSGELSRSDRDVLGVNPYFGKILMHLTFVILVAGLFSVVGMIVNSPILSIASSVVVLVILLVMMFKRVKDQDSVSDYGMVIPYWLVYLIGGLFGFGTGLIFNHYVADGAGYLIVVAFGITVVLMGSLTAFVVLTKRDFSFLGGILFFALIGLIVVSLVGLFLPYGILHLALAYFGVILFSGYMLYDISRMKFYRFEERDVPGAVLDLFINFINLFLDILRILNSFRE